MSGTERVQVTLKLQPGLPSLRTPALKACVEQAIDAGHERFGMRLLKHTLEKDGLSLLVIAPHRRALSRGIQGISVRIARAVNRKLERKGRLFADRYDAQLLADVATAAASRGSAINKAARKQSAGTKAALGKAGINKAAKAAVTKATVTKAAVTKAAVAKAANGKNGVGKSRAVKAGVINAALASSAARRKAPSRGMADTSGPRRGRASSRPAARA